MTWLQRLLQRDRAEHQLDRELRDHLERMVADYQRSGFTESEARRKARLEFGGLEQVKEDCRDARGTRWVDEIVQDLRFGLRLLRLSPAFTLVAVLSHALGIGAKSAIIALVDGVRLDAPRVGDLVAVPATGADSHTMAHNNNGTRRIPVVFARDGAARLVLRRETWADLLARDVG